MKICTKFNMQSLKKVFETNVQNRVKLDFLRTADFSQFSRAIAYFLFLEGRLRNRLCLRSILKFSLKFLKMFSNKSLGKTSGDNNLVPIYLW